MKKTAIVLGAGGFIGSHLIKRLNVEGYHTTGVDLKFPDFCGTKADHFVIGDLRDPLFVETIIHDNTDLVVQLAADMGGSEYIFTGDNDADIMHNSSLINLNIVKQCVAKKVKKIFYSSSACMYPSHNQEDPENPNCEESSAYPADPDSEYGWEKLFSERLYLAFSRNYGLDVRICRYHNIYGPEGTFQGGKEKAPAAMCRKAITGDKTVEVFGDGQQTRSFLYIEDCIDATIALIDSDFTGPVNIGSDEMVTINELANIAIDLSGKDLKILNVDAKHTGVRGRTSDNRLIEEKLGWKRKYILMEGMEKTFRWMKEHLEGEQDENDSHEGGAEEEAGDVDKTDPGELDEN